MRAAPRYPVDRYLVESSKKFEIVNIIDDEFWHQEPSLRPEDEIILRKLHDMLQSTADDLKMLSKELSKFHQSGVQVKSQPTPLDEDFNEKVHIEEIVNAKFHGHKIIDKPTQLPIKKDFNEIKPIVNSDSLRKPKFSTGIQVGSAPVKKRALYSKNLVMTRPKVIEIGEDKDGTNNKLNNGQVIKNMPAVAYNEFSFKYVEPKNKMPLKILQVQHMPKINIRSELKEQKVLHLDIIPESKDNAVNTLSKTNVAVISVDHEVEVNTMPMRKPECLQSVNYPFSTSIIRQTSRKVSKMSAYESSASTNNSDTQHKLNTQKLIKNVLRSSPKNSARLVKSKKATVSKKEPEKKPSLNLEEWKKKLDRVYGHPSTLRSKSYVKPDKKALPKKANGPSSGLSKPPSKVLNNAEYIPYSRLTLGGVRVSDIEREISEIPNKINVPLSPILDKILSSKENSPRKNSKKKSKKKESQNIFTTSDENLLQEVIEIEKTVSETISKNFVQNNKDNKIKKHEVSSDIEDDSYADDFEDEKSDVIQDSDEKPKSKGSSKTGSSDHSDINSGNKTDNDDNDYDQNKSQNIQNTLFRKGTNLSFKKSVDVFEFVHEIDSQETATQSNSTNQISLKETQTSPRNDHPNILPIHNNLWPSIDPKGEVEKLFKLEKDLIKKVILEEYGDLLEKNITKPSTSKDSRDQENSDKNVVAYQKNTQTSPAHVKTVMTSPTRTKTRTTSPFLSVTVDRQTSPVIIVSNEEKVELEIADGEDGISINLSSPRFNLRLPQTSREVLSNLEMSNDTIKVENTNRKQTKQNFNKRPPSEAEKFTNKTYTSSGSIDNDNSSSELSSLGEIKLKLKKRLKKRAPTNSESDSSSTVSKSSCEVPLGGILPLKSEGELSLSQGKRKFCKSDGEASFGQTQ